MTTLPQQILHKITMDNLNLVEWIKDSFYRIMFVLPFVWSSHITLMYSRGEKIYSPSSLSSDAQLCDWSSITEFTLYQCTNLLKKTQPVHIYKGGIGIIQNVRKKTLITEVGVNTNITQKWQKGVYQTLLQDLVKIVKTTGENVL